MASPSGCTAAATSATPTSTRIPGRSIPRTGRAGAGTTKRGAVDGNFARAVAAAVADTRAKWGCFEAHVMATYGPVRGKAIVCAMRNDSESACG